MARPDRRKSSDLKERLERQPFHFDFFQAVRLLERLAKDREPVGRDADPGREVVRFRALPSASFPSSDVNSLAPSHDGLPPELTVSFLGLFGPQGALPRHYTELVIERLHVRSKDPTLRDWLDLFNHRTISLFFRIWEKYRVPVGFERHRRLGPKSSGDLFTQSILSLVGLATPKLGGRLAVDDDSILFYAGHYSHAPRCVQNLRRLLAERFGLKLDIESMVGQWLKLEPNERSRMADARHPRGVNMALGHTMILGDRVWDVQSKFRLVIGPVGYREFCSLLPNTKRILRIAQMVRLYVGAEFDFDAQVILKAEDVPPMQLNSGSEPGPRLGWNTWLLSGPASKDGTEAVFRLGDLA